MIPSFSVARVGGMCAAAMLLLLTSCAAPRSTSTSPTQGATPTMSRITTQIKRYLAQLDQPRSLTGAILVMSGNTVQINVGYGLADAANAVPNTPQTRFRIGSITKQFTGLAILQLQEKGLLHVQDLICPYLDNCPQTWQAITIHELLTHTSGIPDFTGSNQLGVPISLAGLIDRFRNDRLNFTPGSRWSYSSSGYVLLGAIIERVAQQSYPDYLQQHIFGPLQMTATGYAVNDLDLPGHAQGYFSPGRVSSYVDISEAYAAGGMYSTVGDLYIWDQALVSHHLVSVASMAAMLTPYGPCPAGGCMLSSDQGYGYGVGVANQANHPFIYHPGNIDGFNSFNGFYPQDNVFVIVLTNLETTSSTAISLKLGAIVLGQ